MCQGFSNFLVFFIHFLLAKLVTSSIMVNGVDTLRQGQSCSHYGVFTSQRSFLNINGTNGACKLCAQ